MRNEDEKRYIELPEVYSRRELNALYRKIPLRDAKFRMLRKYFNAMANLYGIIPLKKAWEIINEQSPRLVSREEFFAFAEVARHECEDYCILREDELYTDGKASGRLAWKIIDVYLLYNEDGALYEIDAGQQGKPYFVPPKAELLAYDDAAYFESTPQAERLRSFLSRKLQLEREMAEVIFQDIRFYVRSVPSGLQPVVDRLEQAGANLSGKRLGEFAAVYQDFSNHMRMQYNRGHTPVELISMIPPENRFPQSLSFGPNIRTALTDGTLDAAELQQSILTMELPYEELRRLMLDALTEAAPDIGRVYQPPQIGRNDPCPCGSGKKYKRCCGR